MMIRRSGFGALLGTAVGVAALILAAIQNWTADLSGDKLSLRTLVHANLGSTGDFYKSVGGLSILLAVLAALALLEGSGRLSRLVGLAALVVSALFAVEVYRHFGHSPYDSVHGARPGFWLELLAGLALLTTAGSRPARRDRGDRGGRIGRLNRPAAERREDEHREDKHREKESVEAEADTDTLVQPKI